MDNAAIRSPVIDAFSRYLLRCEALVEPDGDHVRAVLDSASLEFGLPAAIRSDGGPPFASTGPVRAQQRVFDPWRREYNHDRPHESLQLRTPASVYAPSGRRYPRPLVKPELDPFSHVVRVDKNGFITWNRRPLFISSALKYEHLAIEPDEDGRWSVSWGAIFLGRLDEHRPERGLITPRRGRGVKEVSAMSLL